MSFVTHYNAQFFTNISVLVRSGVKKISKLDDTSSDKMLLKKSSCIMMKITQFNGDLYIQFHQK